MLAQRKPHRRLKEPVVRCLIQHLRVKQRKQQLVRQVRRKGDAERGRSAVSTVFVYELVCHRQQPLERLVQLEAPLGQYTLMPVVFLSYRGTVKMKRGLHFRAVAPRRLVGALLVFASYEKNGANPHTTAIS